MEYKGAHDQVTFDDVLEVFNIYYHQESIDLINRAYDFIMEKHEGQKRKSGEPYTNHLIWVAYILATLQTDQRQLRQLDCDVMEDCDMTHDEMVERFAKKLQPSLKGLPKLIKCHLKMNLMFMLKIIVKSILLWQKIFVLF